MVWTEEELDFMDKNKEDLNQTTNYSNFCGIWKDGSKISHAKTIYSSRSVGFSNFYDGSFPLFSLAYKFHDWSKTSSGLFLTLVDQYSTFYRSHYILVRLRVFNKNFNPLDCVELFSYETYDKDLYLSAKDLKGVKDPPASFKEKVLEDFRGWVYWKGREILIPWIEDTYMHCVYHILG